MNNNLRNRTIFCSIILATIIIACARIDAVTPAPFQTSQPIPDHQQSPTQEIQMGNDPSLNYLPAGTISVNIERMFADLASLTSIQAGTGYRTSGTDGELEALRLVQSQIENLPYLEQLGVDFELQEFSIYITTEMHGSSMEITIDDQKVTFSADAIRGWLNRPAQAMPLDSDGVLNDNQPDPQTQSAEAIAILSLDVFEETPSAHIADKIVFLPYALIDDTADSSSSWQITDLLFNANPKAVVLVTENSTVTGESHGSFANENGPYSKQAIPVIQIRLEELGEAGISNINDLKKITYAEVTWDTDVLSPAKSHNLVVRIPGTDPSRAMIISAHIDSVANPGAMDDGSGSIILLEIARVLDENRVQPLNDLYLVWYGSEELGLYGSSHFVNTHSELLDRAIANLQIDCLTRPMDGTQAYIQFAFWPADGTDVESSHWVNTMQQIAQKMGFETHKMILDMASDNGVMDGFNVPNFDLIYTSDDEMESIGGIWYGGHIHDPYDNVSTAREVSDVFKQMGNIALQAALLPTDFPEMRSVTNSEKQLIILASKNEPPLTFPINLREFGMVMAQAALDVDVIAYEENFEYKDLIGASAVLVLPSADYAGQSNAVTSYDVSWNEQEIAALEQYVSNGGLLILTNTRAVWGFYDYGMDENEDWEDMNDIAGRFGITFDAYLPYPGYTRVQPGHPITLGLSNLIIDSGNSIPFTMQNGQVLAGTDSAVLVGSVNYGANGGEVLALADLALLARDWQALMNLEFVANLAAYIQQR